MKVGIISDTHDNLAVVKAAADIFEERADAVVHCGDVIAPFTVTPFDGDYDFYVVRGNNDGEWTLQDAVRSFGVYFGEFGQLSLGGASVAVYHGTSPAIVDALVGCGEYDYVFSGHTHQRVHDEIDGTVHLNPGGVPTGSDDEEPPAAVILDTETGDVTFHDLPT